MSAIFERSYDSANYISVGPSCFSPYNTFLKYNFLQADYDFLKRLEKRIKVGTLGSRESLKTLPDVSKQVCKVCHSTTSIHT
jgi:hypothetical protein